MSSVEYTVHEFFELQYLHRIITIIIFEVEDI